MSYDYDKYSYKQVKRIKTAHCGACKKLIEKNEHAFIVYGTDETCLGDIPIMISITCANKNCLYEFLDKNINERIDYDKKRIEKILSKNKSNN